MISLATLYNITCVFQFDKWSNSTSWSVIDELNNQTQVLFGKGGVAYGESTGTALVESSCFTFNVLDAWGDGFCCDDGNGWFELYLNDYLLSFGKQTFYDSRVTIYFCTELFDYLESSVYHNDTTTQPNNITTTTTDNNNNMTLLTVDLNYDAELSLQSSTTSTWFYGNTIDRSPTEKSNNIIESRTFLFPNGTNCIDISVANDNNDNEVKYYGNCTFKINNEIAGYSGNYKVFETTTVCRNKNDISYCITPKYCSQFNKIAMTSIELNNDNNKNNDWNYNEDDSYNDNIFINGYSYKSLANISMEYINLTGVNNDIYVYNYSGTTINYNLDCLGAYSCANSQFYARRTLSLFCEGAFSCQNNTFYGYVPTTFCMAIGSCTSIQTDIIHITAESLQSMVGESAIEAGLGQITLMSPLAVTNGVLNFKYIHKQHIDTYDSEIQLYDYFSFFNTTIKCETDSSVVIRITCLKNKQKLQYPQHFIIDDSCNDNEHNVTINSSGCNFYYKYKNFDNRHTMYEEITQNTLDMIENIASMADDLVESKIPKCDDFHDAYDIGHPFASGQDVVTERSICCRGDQSCARADAIQPANGDVLCLGHRSCASIGFIWAAANGTNIYCVASGACAQSTLEAANNILCASSDACEDAFILSANTLYCTQYHVCNGIIIRNVKNIYFIREQGGVIIYSGNIGESHLYLKANESGTDVIYHCEQNDVCYIDCEEGACGETTRLYCDGKCVVNCSNSNGSDCVTFERSGAPTLAPTNAATEDKNLLSGSVISVWFNYILSILAGLWSLIMIIGYIDAFYIRSNDLYEWTAILLGAFYTNDFVSDVFFSLKLANIAFYGEYGANHEAYFLILFILSIAFIIIPFWGNIFPLHLAISKWARDQMLTDTGLFMYLMCCVLPIL